MKHDDEKEMHGDTKAAMERARAECEKQGMTYDEMCREASKRRGQVAAR